jgi:hypothetical protein
MHEKDSPLSIYFDLVDNYLSSGCDVTKAMILANNQMGVAQKEKRVFPSDLFLQTMKDIEHMIKQRPDHGKYEVAYA